ncbi:MAG: PTS system mannose/fructose/sorbose family transporter subunit IID [Candidatus Zixiibacteriota bacterium]|nr:MAG: PTS system mannose/fructose/sorbose family transporter subunit IID [candidate division Zixibacteria bacterium]
MQRVSGFDLFRLTVRSFFVQAGWSYDRMMALGFAWILAPVAKKLFSSVRERQEFLRRHLDSFNANPYLAGYAVGAVTRLEETKTPPEQVRRFKESLRGPLGALGDNLIWQNLRPALLILGLILTGKYGLYGALTFFVLFNCYQIYIRARGVIKGYQLGLKVSSDLTGGHLQNVTKWSGRIGAGLFGFLFVVKLRHVGMGPFQPDKAILLILFSLLSFWGLKRNLNPGLILLIFLLFLTVMNAVPGLI